VDRQKSAIFTGPSRGGGGRPTWLASRGPRRAPAGTLRRTAATFLTALYTIVSGMSQCGEAAASIELLRRCQPVALTVRKVRGIVSVLSLALVLGRRGR